MEYFESIKSELDQVFPDGDMASAECYLSEDTYIVLFWDNVFFKNMLSCKVFSKTQKVPQFILKVGEQRIPFFIDESLPLGRIKIKENTDGA